MRYQIKYAAVCFTGLIRSHNEDNYNISGIYRQVDEPDREELLSGTAAVPGRRTFAVFDGMGGESCGEMASYIAAMHFDRLMKRRRSLWEVFHPEEYISRNLLEINGEICRYASEHKIRSMGTTAAVLFFDSKNVIWANLGDSRIYRFRRTGKGLSGKDPIERVSEDHANKGIFGRKGGLTQYLGLPEEEARIEPFLQSASVDGRYGYLLCSDGLTDLVNDQEIGRILQENDTPETAIREMKETVLANGGTDNTTIIICLPIV